MLGRSALDLPGAVEANDPNTRVSAARKVQNLPIVLVSCPLRSASPSASTSHAFGRWNASNSSVLGGRLGWRQPDFTNRGEREVLEIREKKADLAKFRLQRVS